MPVISRHRFAFAIMIGVYPIITMVMYALEPFTSRWPIWCETLVVVPIMVTLLVWGVIPQIHLRLGWWLHRRKGTQDV